MKHCYLKWSLNLRWQGIDQLIFGSSVFLFFLGALVRVRPLLIFILSGGSSSELVCWGGVSGWPASVGTPAWISAGAGPASSRSSRVDDRFLGGCSSGSLPWMIARILLYSGLSSSISNYGSSGSVGGEESKPWQGPSSSARWTSLLELLMRSGGRLVLDLLMRLSALK